MIQAFLDKQADNPIRVEKKIAPTGLLGSDYRVQRLQLRRLRQYKDRRRQRIHMRSIGGRLRGRNGSGGYSRHGEMWKSLQSSLASLRAADEGGRQERHSRLTASIDPIRRFTCFPFEPVEFGSCAPLTEIFWPCINRCVLLEVLYRI
jgi:hypothetical protein